MCLYWRILVLGLSVYKRILYRDIPIYRISLCRGIPLQGKPHVGVSLCAVRCGHKRSRPHKQQSPWICKNDASLVVIFRWRFCFRRTVQRLKLLKPEYTWVTLSPGLPLKGVPCRPGEPDGGVRPAAALSNKARHTTPPPALISPGARWPGAAAAGGGGRAVPTLNGGHTLWRPKLEHVKRVVRRPHSRALHQCGPSRVW